MPDGGASVVAWIAAGIKAVGVTGAFTVAGTQIFYATIIAYAIVIAAAVAYSSYQSRKARAQNAGRGALGGVDPGRLFTSREPTQPRRLIYGRCLVAGCLTFWNIAGAENEYLHLCLAVAGHECEELGEVYFGDKLVTLDGSGNALGEYTGYARVIKHLGSPSQTVDATLMAENPSFITSDFRGRGVAYLYVRLKYSTDIFPQGLPNITCMVKGKKVYDWRSSTTYWTDNAALCTADYLMHPKFGKGIAQSRIRSADITEAAGVSDEVVITLLGEERRYTVNGTINADQDPDEALLDLCGAMAGMVADPGSSWTIHAGAYRTPVLTLSDSDMVGSLRVSPRMSRKDTCNGVKGVFISPDNQWAAADFPAVKNDTYMGWDGGVRLWRELPLAFTTSSSMAQRLAKIELERARQQISVSQVFMLKALQAQPGSIILLNHPRYGWAEKEFEVVNFEFQAVGESENPTLGIALQLRETASGVWDWNDGEETTVDLAPNTNLYDPAAVAAPTGLNLSMASTVQEGGAIVPRMRVAWNQSTDVFVQSGGYVHIEYKEHSASAWTVWTTGLRGDATFDYITDISAAAAYDVRVRFQNVNGARSAYATQTSYTAGGASLAVPSVDYPGQNFTGSITVTASVPGGQVLRYSTDGTPVTSNSAAATGGGGTSEVFVITSETKLRLRAFSASDPTQFSLEREELYYIGVGGGGGGLNFTLTLIGHPSGLQVPTADGSAGGGSFPAGSVLTLYADTNVSGDAFLQWSAPWPEYDNIQNPTLNSTSFLLVKDSVVYADY